MSHTSRSVDRTFLVNTSEVMTSDKLPVPEHHDSEDTADSIEDRCATRIVEESKCVVNDHYQLEVSLRENVLPNNCAVAHYRVQTLRRKLECDPELLRKYKEKIKDMKQKGYLLIWCM